MEESFADVHRFSDNSKTDFERDRSALSSYLNNNDKVNFHYNYWVDKLK